MDLYRIPGNANQCLTLTVPVPPSVNHMYYNTRGGGKRLTKKAEQYFNFVAQRAKQAVEAQEWTLAEKGIWLNMETAFYFPDKRIRDNHNCYKILIDALQGIVFKNDYYVMPSTKLVELDRGMPRAVVRFTHKSEEERLKDLQFFNNMIQ